MSSNARSKGRSSRRLKRPTKVTPARWVAWQTLRRTFDDGAWTDRAFSQLAEQLELDGRERAFAQLLTYGTVQQAKRLDHVIATLGKRPLAKLDPPVLHALRIGMFELLVLGAQRDDANEVVPGGASAHAAVSQAVELVRGVVGERAVAFTNAILRRAQVDGAGILAKLDPARPADLAVQLSMPEWLVARVQADHGDIGIAALAAQNESVGATAFRINPAGPSAVPGSDVAQQLLDAGATLATPTFQRATPLALEVVGSTAPVGRLIADGSLVPQSLASQLVATVLDAQPGERVLDLCAAPGGKTTHIASMVGRDGNVTAVELHEHRADSVRALATKLGVADIVTVQCADSTQVTLDELGGELFDRVLVDAPCSGTGVLAARPDARWKRTDDGIDELVDLQRDLLAAAARFVRPGGVVVYSTCSILSAEDEGIVAGHADLGLVADDLPAAIPDNVRLDAWRARTWPQVHGTEGFFMARMRRAEDN